MASNDRAATSDTSGIGESSELALIPMLESDPDDPDELDLFTWTCSIVVRERKKLGLKTEKRRKEKEMRRELWRS